MSKLDVAVSIVTGAADCAVQRYHTDAPPELPAWLGSPASLLAPTFEPFAVPVAPASVWALANMSSAGLTAWFQWRVTFPVAVL